MTGKVDGLECSQCGKICKNKKGLIKHMTYANHFDREQRPHKRKPGTDEDVYRCVCAKEFRNSRELQTHVDFANQNLKRFSKGKQQQPVAEEKEPDSGVNKCICGKIYVHKKRLLKHMKEMDHFEDVQPRQKTSEAAKPYNTRTVDKSRHPEGEDAD